MHSSITRIGVFALAFMGLLRIPLYAEEPSGAVKLDYAKHSVTVTDMDRPFEKWDSDSQSVVLADGIGAEPYPVSGNGWYRSDAPAPGKPAVVVIDYKSPVKVAALAHYFYVPGCRDMKGPTHLVGSPQAPNDWSAGPSAFREVKLYTSDDQKNWTEAAHLAELPPSCPQLLKLDKPAAARYLKLEVLSLAEGSGSLRSYELETYLNEVPQSLPAGDKGKAVRVGYPNKSAMEKAGAALTGTVAQDKDTIGVAFTLPAMGFEQPLAGFVEALVDGKPVAWKTVDRGEAKGEVAEGGVTMKWEFVKAGLLLTFDWTGRINPRYPKLEIRASMNGPLSEWFLPMAFYGRTAPGRTIATAAPGMMNNFTLIGDTQRTLGIIPDTDQCMLGLNNRSVIAEFPLREESHRVLLLAAAGDMRAFYRRAVIDVYDFNDPRQFKPVTETLDQMCNFLMSTPLWSEKYQMIRSFPDRDFFFIFYTIPYAIPALSYWEKLSGEPRVTERIDKILQFTLDRRIPLGPMKGALYSEYADNELAVKGVGGYQPGPVIWCLPDETLVGMDQSGNRWITSHNMGAVLWSITQVWESRGKVSDGVKQGAKGVADWMMSHMREDGSWPYAWYADGRVANEESDSGTIWNVWALYRYGKLTGDARYSEAAQKTLAYFKKNFTDANQYRGYWEDHYPGERKPLDAGQGYEATIAVMAYDEMGDKESMLKSMYGILPFVCTRTLESRDYFTSYGQSAESGGYAPGTYMNPTIGRVAQLCQRYTKDEFFGRYANIATTMGWWQYELTGGSFWMTEAFRPTPIEMYRDGRSVNMSFWSWWDSGSKVAFTIPWMADLIRERTGGKIAIDVNTIQGTDDRDRKVEMRMFKGKVASESKQVNWMGLGPQADKWTDADQLVLINHAEETPVTVAPPPGVANLQATARLIDAMGKTRKLAVEQRDGQWTLVMPRQSVAVVDWTADR